MLRDADAWARQTEVQADRRELPADPNQLRAITLGQLISRSLFCCLPRRQLREIKPSLVARELAPVRHMLEIARREWGIPLRQNPLAQLSIKGHDPRR